MVLMASHMATSAAAMNTWPLTMPPARSLQLPLAARQAHRPSSLSNRVGLRWMPGMSCEPYSGPTAHPMPPECSTFGIQFK